MQSDWRYFMKGIMIALFTQLVMLGLWFWVIQVKASNFFNKSGMFIAVCVTINILLSLLLDYLGFIATTKFTTERDLLRLTNLSARGFFRMSHKLALDQVRLFMFFIISMRSLIAELTVLHTFIGIYSIWGDYDITRSMYFYNSEEYLIIPLLGIFAAALLEPLWRIRAIIALGLLFDSEHRNFFPLLVLAIWGIQLLMLGMGLLGWFLLLPMFRQFIATTTILTGTFGLIFVTFLIVEIGGFLFYGALRYWSLRTIIRRW